MLTIHKNVKRAVFVHIAQKNDNKFSCIQVKSAKNIDFKVDRPLFCDYNNY